MNAHDLIQLGAQVATQGNRLLLSNREVPVELVQEYWIHTKCRIGHWNLELKRLAESGNDEARGSWQPVYSELLCSELLQRVWGAIVVAYDTTTRDRARSSFIENLAQAQTETSNRFLHLASSGKIGATINKRICTLRRRVERWTDVLLSELVVTCDVEDFAFEFERVNEFHDDLYSGGPLDVEDRWKLLLQSLERAFQMPDARECAQPHLNRSIADTILCCLEHDPFETRLLKDPYWMEQVSLNTERTQTLVRELLQEL